MGTFRLKGCDLMCFSLEHNIANDINKDQMAYEESLNFLDNLAWANWDMLRVNYTDELYKILHYLSDGSFDKKQNEFICKLYRFQI